MPRYCMVKVIKNALNNYFNTFYEISLFGRNDLLNLILTSLSSFFFFANLKSSTIPQLIENKIKSVTLSEIHIQ